ncbi:hypothetical protein EYZ11_005292 [Aspergillus tanneri]|uniref:Uncharacterized protein n=1 Tax=Aspergillus tanneri TaxID=1220188 RepID=A0A4S3JIX0_9EURO|nr:hypothetical protein EYZ11_005292 [Aspergillus tanneri]
MVADENVYVALVILRMDHS